MDVADLTLAMLNLVNWPVVWFRPGGSRTPEELGKQYADLFVDGARAAR
jgi:hypothetical protein